ncbi:MAG: iron-containing alcohol dehydrogenase [Anaerolineae bacterium]|nr:iron-containing alcohol dehydrogenase [Anaerolineae bacterium]
MFNFDAKTSVLFGFNTIKELGPEAIKLGAKNVLVVTDRGIVQAGLLEKVNESLNASGINVAVFDGIEPNPSDKSLVVGGQAARDHQADMIIGLGGGSPMDAAKGIAIMTNNDGTVESYVEVLDAWPNTPLPVICIPTTAGTGAEVSRAAMVNLTEKKIKKALFGATIQPQLAVVDPSLTLGLPSHLTAQTGVDALCHAFEAYIAKFSNPISDALAVEAIKLAAANLREAVKHGDNLEARSNMLLASTIAVISASSAGLGVVHSLAQTLGGFYNLPHGLSIAVCFPYGIGYNLVAEPEKCAHVSRMLGTDTSNMSDEEAANSVVAALRTLNADLEIHDDLRSLGFQEADLPVLAKYSVEDGNTPTNPRVFDVDAATTLYQSMLN